MAQPSIEQIEFFERHEIPLSRVFDATGYATNEYKVIMRTLDMLVAIGVTPCSKAGHTVRSRAGHCVQCGTHNLAFLRRFELPGEVYVATSESVGLTKIGTAQDATLRLQSLNYFGYGGATDWKLFFVRRCGSAGKVEFATQQGLREFIAWRQYRKQGNLVVCHEVFDCPASMAAKAIEIAAQVLCPL